MFLLGDDFEQELADHDEFGMGYHVLQVRFSDRGLRHTGEWETHVIFNMEVAVGVDELDQLDEIDFNELIEYESEMGFGEFVAERRDEIQLLEYDEDNVRIYPNDFELGDFFPDETFSPKPRLHRTTRPFEGFIRVSAYPNDKRINQSDGSVLPGTYATTVKDSEEVPSGFAAAGRYALPNPATARFVYPIIPNLYQNSSVRITGGTVRPAYRQAGGGVEVLFQDWLPSQSALPTPHRIPEV
jgi:hypothetical protein